MIRNIQSFQDYPRSSGITLSAKQSDIPTAKSIITDRKITGINPSQSKCHIAMCVLGLAHTRGTAAAIGLFNPQGHREVIYFLIYAKNRVKGLYLISVSEIWPTVILCTKCLSEKCVSSFDDVFFSNYFKIVNIYIDVGFIH